MAKRLQGLPHSWVVLFGSSQLSQIILVFKKSSVYAVDVEASDVQRLETHGHGCTAPDSIASTSAGIMFANESGIYRINRNLTMSDVGEPMERLWRNSVNKDSLTSAVGFHYNIENRYQLSLPMDTATTNSECYVYDHSREGKGQDLGAWTRFDNHDITAAVNDNQDLYMGTARGGVVSYRREGLDSDYRDESSAITARILYKACSFGDEGRRKVCGGVITHWRAVGNTSTTSLTTAVDLEDNFEAADTFSLATDAASAGLSSSFDYKVQTFKSSIPNRRFNYLQVKLENAALDEPIELVGIDFVVSGLTSKGVRESGQ